MDSILNMPKLRNVLPHYVGSVNEHFQEWQDCLACRFGQNGGKKIFFRGYIPADVLYIGEAAGESEHSTGLPFVGPCGNPIDTIILQVAERLGMNYKWCICNSVLCSPFDESAQFTTPKLADVKCCQPRVLQFLSIVQPALVVRVGKVAEKLVLPGKSITIYHPSFMLRGDVDTAIKRAAYQIHQVLAPILGVK